MTAPINRMLRDALLGAAGVLMWLAAWWSMGALLSLWESPLAPFVSSPARVLRTFLSSLFVVSTWTHAASTILFSLSGLLLAALIGVPTGLLMGRFHPVAAFLGPLVEAFRGLPSAAVIPVAMILMRSNGWEKTIFVITFGSTWPVLVNTWDSVRSLPVEFRDTLKLLPISEWTALRLTLRRAFGGVASGLRVSASVSLILTITIEMFAPGSWEYGIGQLIRLAETNGDYDGIYAAIILLMILGYTLNAATHALVQVSTAPAKVDPDASPARREDLEMYLPEGLRGLPEQAIRVLTVDQVTETLMEIYAARGVAFELLDCQVSPDNVARRVVRFTAGSPPQPLLIGGATVYLDAMEHALGDSPDTWLSVRRELDRRSLGLIVRDHLGARVVYEDSSLELMSRPSRGTSPAAKRSAELPGRVVRRCREIRAAGGRALLANIEEFVAIDVIAGRPVATEGPTHISRAS